MNLFLDIIATLVVGIIALVLLPILLPLNVAIVNLDWFMSNTNRT